MTIKGTSWDPLKVAQATEQGVPKNLSADTNFRSILAMMQDDGIIARDAEAGDATLTAAQKEALQKAFDIENMSSYADKRALLNELVGLGALSAETSELSMCQLLPPQGLGAGIGTGSVGLLGGFGAFDSAAGLEEMLSEPNYLRYLEKAMAFDEQWSRSDDVKNARQTVYDILSGIFG